MAQMNSRLQSMSKRTMILTEAKRINVHMCRGFLLWRISARRLLLTSEQQQQQQPFMQSTPSLWRQTRYMRPKSEDDRPPVDYEAVHVGLSDGLITRVIIWFNELLSPSIFLVGQSLCFIGISCLLIGPRVSIREFRLPSFNAEESRDANIRTQ